MLSNNLEIFRARAEMWAESERPDTFPITAEDMLKFVAVAEAAEAVKASRSIWRKHDDSCPCKEDVTAPCYCGARSGTERDRMALEHKLFAALDALAATLGGGDK